MFWACIHAGGKSWLCHGTFFPTGLCQVEPRSLGCASVGLVVITLRWNADPFSRNKLVKAQVSSLRGGEGKISGSKPPFRRSKVTLIKVRYATVKVPN